MRVIYKITNTINNKIYIGQTINFKKRMKEHRYGRNYKENSIIDRAIKKYGYENFITEIIDTAQTQNEIDEKEKYYIKIFNSLKPHGYNVLKGGRNAQGSWNSKRIYVYDLKGDFLETCESANEYSRLHPEYSAGSIRENCSGKNKRHKDKIFSYKKEKVSYVKPENNRKRKISQYTLLGKFVCDYNSVSEASIITKIPRSYISGCLIGKTKSSANYIWIYFEEKHKIQQKVKAKKELIRKNKVIEQYDLDMNLIATYNNCTEAQNKNFFRKGAYKCIYKVLDKNQKMYGFYWKTRKV